MSKWLISPFSHKAKEGLFFTGEENAGLAVSS